MTQIAVTIIDPRNHRSAHLVETRLPIREVIPPTVKLLKLPERATYQLFPLGSENALPDERTLAEMGVPAGAELQLRPVRNQMLKAILDKLYEEAQGYVEEQAWELAKAKLEELFALNPKYPDPRDLGAAVAAHAGALRGVPHTARFAQRSQPTAAARTFAARTYAASSAGAAPAARVTAFGARAASSPEVVAPAGRVYQLTPEAAKSSGVSCLGITLLIAGVVAAGAIALVGAVFLLPGFLDNMAERLGVALPGSVVLGTGDVQVTLRWEGDADLDLHVVDPSGEEIWFAKAEAGSGGILDVDANGACEGLARPVENVYWPTGEAPDGSYGVIVVYYQSCGAVGPTNYVISVTLDGEVVEEINAQISSEGERHPVTNFQY